MAGNNFKKDMRQNDIVDSARAFFTSFGVLFLIFLIALVVSLAYPQKQEAAEGPGGATTTVDPDKIFQANCASCHGQNLEGIVGPKLANIGSQLSEKEISDIIHNGKGIMPPGILTDPKEVSAVAKWLSEKK
jgi:cytochrome c551/cytochrome c550